MMSRLTFICCLLSLVTLSHAKGKKCKLNLNPTGQLNSCEIVDATYSVRFSLTSKQKNYPFAKHIKTLLVFFEKGQDFAEHFQADLNDKEKTLQALDVVLIGAGNITSRLNLLTSTTARVGLVCADSSKTALGDSLALTLTIEKIPSAGFSKKLSSSPSYTKCNDAKEIPLKRVKKL